MIKAYCEYCNGEYDSRHIQRHTKKCIYNPNNIEKVNKILQRTPHTRKELHKLLLKFGLSAPWAKKNQKFKHLENWFDVFLFILFDIENKYPNQIDFELIDYYFIRLFKKYYYYDLQTYDERIHYAQQVLGIQIPKENEELFLINVAIHNFDDKSFILEFAPELLEENNKQYYDKLNYTK